MIDDDDDAWLAMRGLHAQGKGREEDEGPLEGPNKKPAPLVTWTRMPTEGSIARLLARSLLQDNDDGDGVRKARVL